MMTPNWTNLHPNCLLLRVSTAFPTKRHDYPIAKAPGRFKFTKNRAHFFDLTACFFSFSFHFSEVLNGLNAFPKAFSKPSPKPSQHYFREASLNLSLNFSYFFPSVFPWGNTRKKEEKFRDRFREGLGDGLGEGLGNALGKYLGNVL